MVGLGTFATAEMQCRRSLWHRECKVRAPTRVRARVQVRVAHARACTRVRAAVAMESTWWLGLLMWQVFTTTGSCAGVAHPRPPCRNTLVPTRWQPAAGAREHGNGVGVAAPLPIACHTRVSLTLVCPSCSLPFLPHPTPDLPCLSACRRASASTSRRSTPPLRCAEVAARAVRCRLRSMDGPWRRIRKRRIAACAWRVCVCVLVCLCVCVC